MNILKYLKPYINIRFLIIFITIYISNDTSLFGTNEDVFFITLNRAVLYVLFVLSLLYLLKRRKIRKYYLFLFGVVSCMLLTIIANYNFSGGFIQLFMLLIIGLYFIEEYSFVDFCYYFEKILFTLSAFGLVFFILNILSGGLQSYFVVTNSHGASFSHFGIWANLNNGLNIFRNTSIFREPGVYMIYIIFALLINIYVIGVNKKHFFILMASLISTLSTAGIIIGCIVCLLYFRRLKTNTRYYIYLLFIVLLLFLYPIIEQTEYYLNVMGKFNPDNDSYASFMARTSSIFVPLKIAQTHILGVGFSNFSDVYETVSSKMYGISLGIGSSTNLITNMIARFGWLWGVVLIKLVSNLSAKFSKKSRDRWGVFLVICLCFFNEDLWNSYIFTILILYGLRKKRHEKDSYNLCESNNR